MEVRSGVVAVVGGSTWLVAIVVEPQKQQTRRRVVGAGGNVEIFDLYRELRDEADLGLSVLGLETDLTLWIFTFPACHDKSPHDLPAIQEENHPKCW